MTRVSVCTLAALSALSLILGACQTTASKTDSAMARSEIAMAKVQPNMAEYRATDPATGGKEAALAAGGRILSPEEAQELVTGKTISVMSHVGYRWEVTYNPDQTAMMVDLKNNRENPAIWEISEAGEVCYEFVKTGYSSCQIIIDMGDETYSYFDETGKWRSTFQLK